MNENIDLTKILKDCPKGTKLYSPIFGEVYFKEIRSDYEYSIITTNGVYTVTFTEEGFYRADTDGECVLFPSKDQRDWSKFTAPWYKKNKWVIPNFKVGDRVRHKVTNKGDVYEISKVYDDSYGIAGDTWLIKMEYQDLYELVPNKFDPKTLKPFDKVLVRNSKTDIWRCEHFSHLNDCDSFPYMCSTLYTFCVPYNDDTKHLVGTKDEAPEYYRYWED